MKWAVFLVIALLLPFGCRSTPPPAGQSPIVQNIKDLQGNVQNTTQAVQNFQTDINRMKIEIESARGQRRMFAGIIVMLTGVMLIAWAAPAFRDGKFFKWALAGAGIAIVLLGATLVLR